MTVAAVELWGTRIGAVALSEPSGVAAFEYEPSFLVSGVQLAPLMMPLAERGINLSKIESRPSKKRPWDYFFFLDVTGHYEDENMRAAIAELRKFCPLVKWLGSYPSAS